ncbi:MAG: glycosyltransferase family 4 protein [Gammaproteobacteria bacterium]
MNEVNLVLHLLVPLVWVYLLSHVLIFMVRQYSIIDVPNSRSLHDAPTPTAGGAVIALILTGWLFYQGNSFPDGYALAWVGLGFAILGGWDDIAPKGVLFRVFFQLVLALFFVYLLFGLTPFHLSGLIIVLTIISTVNIFNFMDGADGFAGTQAALFVLSHIFFFDQINVYSYTPYMTILLGCILGFLLLNTRNPARIFMGDVGSYFIGFHIVVIGILGVRGGLSLCVPMLLFAPFIVDSSLTLGARVFSGQSWWQAHRSHLYQKLILAGATPRKVTFKLLLLNCFYCWPAAWMAHTCQDYSLLILSGVYVSLSLVWYHLRKRHI